MNSYATYITTKQEESKALRLPENTEKALILLSLFFTLTLSKLFNKQGTKGGEVGGVGMATSEAPLKPPKD